MRVTPTATASAAARRPSASSRPTNRTSCSGSASHASFVPKPARSAVMQTASGMWASSNWSSVRTSTTSAPAARWRSSWRGASGCGSAPSCSSGPRLTATMLRKFGGCGPSVDSAARTNSSSSSIASVALCARSKPIVEETFRSMPGPPHIEPPRCPGHSSTSGGSESSRSRSERKTPRAPSSLSTARSGRATSPTNRLSPESTAQGASSPRAVSSSRNAVCSGLCPGVCSARTRSAPSSSSQPSSNGSCA